MVRIGYADWQIDRSRMTLAGISLIITVVATAALAPLIKTEVGIFGIIPVITFAWLFGLRAGLITSVLTCGAFLLYCGLAGYTTIPVANWVGLISLFVVGGVIGKLRDLSEALRVARDEMEQRVIERTFELTYANERLQQLDQLKSNFVDDISHELRTPLTNIRLFVELLEQGKPSKRDEYFKILKKEIGRLERLVLDILNLSQLEVEKGKIEFTLVNMIDIVGEVVDSLGPWAYAKGLILSFDPEQDLPCIWGNRTKLNSVVTNLLTNAINYTAEGTVRVYLYSSDEGNRVNLSVKDSGRGISSKEIPFLFDRFYRGKGVSQSNKPGFGLGLAIVKNIVDLHNGEIRVESEPGKGSAFIVSFPKDRRGELPQNNDLFQESLVTFLNRVNSREREKVF